METWTWILLIVAVLLLAAAAAGGLTFELLVAEWRDFVSRRHRIKSR
jgi:hypothetical protein